jgi:hypothetical protein
MMAADLARVTAVEVLEEGSEEGEEEGSEEVLVPRRTAEVPERSSCSLPAILSAGRSPSLRARMAALFFGLSLALPNTVFGLVESTDGLGLNPIPLA